jgi:prophage antirepressor-like protein
VQIDGQPWFVASDCAKALGLNTESGLAKLLSRLSVAEVTRSRIPGKGGANAALITESGLYKLIMRSDKPEARKFQDWVTQAVMSAPQQTR